jgi:archaellum biogenesis protein FlaJ (TadC family)
MGEMVQALKRIYNDAEDAGGDSHPQGIIVSDDDR